MKKKTLVIDLDRCIGCYSCEISCKNENLIDLGVYYNKVQTMGPSGKFPDIEMYYLPTVCQSCKNAPCVEVCPTGASYINDEGVILIDKAKCIGCLACMSACPYGARSFNVGVGVVEKCTLCDHLKAPDKPACVKACCAKARFVGDIEDPDSDVSKAIKAAGKENVHSLPDSGNGPTVRYILHDKTAKWINKEQWKFFPDAD
ncbi:4Fe-4S dicluster domain-containing protein [Geovibrio sp. ADMFC3]